MNTLTFDKVRGPLTDWLTTYIDLLHANHDNFIKKTDIGKAMYSCAINHRRILWGWQHQPHYARLNNSLQIMINYYDNYRHNENRYLIHKTTEWQLLKEHLEFLFITCSKLISRID